MSEKVVHLCRNKIKELHVKRKQCKGAERRIIEKR